MSDRVGSDTPLWPHFTDYQTKLVSDHFIFAIGLRAKPERFRRKGGARPSRSHWSASRRPAEQRSSTHCLVRPLSPPKAIGGTPMAATGPPARRLRLGETVALPFFTEPFRLKVPRTLDSDLVVFITKTGVRRIASMLVKRARGPPLGKLVVHPDPGSIVGI